MKFIQAILERALIKTNFILDLTLPTDGLKNFTDVTKVN
jgi:hypothetical protein